MKKHLYRIAAALGLIAVILAACASDSGADLIYTVPAAIAGCVLCWYGASKARQIAIAEKWAAQRIHNNRAAYRDGLKRAAIKHV